MLDVIDRIETSLVCGPPHASDPKGEVERAGDGASPGAHGVVPDANPSTTSPSWPSLFAPGGQFFCRCEEEHGEQTGCEVKFAEVNNKRSKLQQVGFNCLAPARPTRPGQHQHAVKQFGAPGVSGCVAGHHGKVLPWHTTSSFQFSGRVEYFPVRPDINLGTISMTCQQDRYSRSWRSPN